MLGIPVEELRSALPELTPGLIDALADVLVRFEEVIAELNAGVPS